MTDLRYTSKPLIKLRIHSELTGVTIEINGCPVLSRLDGDQFTTDWPINEWLHRGENTIRVLISKPDLREPGDDDDLPPEWVSASCLGVGLTLSRSQKSEVTSLGALIWNFRDVVVAKGKYQVHGGSVAEDKADEMKLDRKGTVRDWDVLKCSGLEFSSTGQTIAFSRTFRLPADWPECRWSDASELTDTPGNLFSLKVTYQNVWDLLESRNIPELRRLMVRRSRAWGTAYFLETEEEIDEALSIIPAMQQGTWRMRPLDLSDAKLMIYPNRRIAELRNAGDHRTPMQFTDADDMLGGVEVALSMINGKWVWVI